MIPSFPADTIVDPSYETDNDLIASLCWPVTYDILVSLSTSHTLILLFV